MILLGLLWLFIASRLPNRDPVRLYTASDTAPFKKVSPEAKAAARKNSRKLHKKLR
jgi:hypothetical protein